MERPEIQDPKQDQVKTPLPKHDKPFAMIGEIVLFFPPWEPGIPIPAVVVQDNRCDFMEGEIHVVALSRTGCLPVSATWSRGGEPGTWHFRESLPEHQ